jgi:FkbH-like protein
MSFLEASKVSKACQGLPEADICIKTSASLHQLNVYLKAFGVNSGFNLCITSIEFGTLKQSLYQQSSDTRDIFVLFPWDFFGGLDWRTGVTSESNSISSAIIEVDAFFDLMSVKGSGNFFYLETELPPAMGLKSDMLVLNDHISAVARRLGCTILKSDSFCLKTYLANACPFSSASLCYIADSIISNIFGEIKSLKKVIVTDLDFTFWYGVLGEVGYDGIEYSSSGSGYIHFIYQTFLKKLKDSGVIICICSKNDADLVELAFRENTFIISYDEFVSIQASYRSKSSQIKGLSASLNIGLDDFVFIDDNPTEIEEVKTALPAIQCIQFPKDVRQFPNMIDELHSVFQISNITDEDVNRTDLYKRMKISNVESADKDTDINEFLKSLNMELEIATRTSSDNDRAVQLINKTNQFNSNGVRRLNDECDDLLDNGGRLITGSLRDKNGNHGEVLAILIDQNNEVLSFVMSCRVFQRQAEIVFIYAILESGIEFLSIDYKKTERNEPFRLFLSRFFPKVKSGKYTLTPKLILDSYPRAQKLYKVKGQQL